MSSSWNRQPRRVGLGVVAIIGALFVCAAGILFGAVLSTQQALASAVVGGGSTLSALLLARWGYRALATPGRSS